MKKPGVIILLFLLVLSSASAQRTSTSRYRAPNFYQVRSEMLEKIKNADAIEESAGEEDGLFAKFKRWEHFMRQRTYPSGEFFKPDALMNEFKRYQQEKESEPSLQNLGWTALGPFDVPAPIDSFLAPGVGRINCIAIHPTDSNILFVGTACGGIWKTIDGGLNWASSNDQLPSMSFTDISINQQNPDTIYAATGDAAGNWVFDSNWNVFFPGGHYASGILMSADGGQTWNQTGLTYAQAQTVVIYRVIVNPVQTNIVMAATAEGLYRSIDAGATWTQTDTGKIYDLMLNPLDASQLYMIAGRKVKRSFDYGATWITFSYNIPTPESTSRFAISPADTSRIVISRSSGAVLRSTNGGTNFTQISNVSVFGHQSDYDKAIAISPTDANMVYLGIVPLVKSRNAGITWSEISSFTNTRPNFIHPDFHGLQFSPHNPNKIYAVNDGGVYVSSDTGATWLSLNTGISISQYYKVSSSYTNPELILGGTQDNSTHRYDGINWKTVTCCDGMDNAVDFTDENICYASIQLGYFLRSDNGGLSFNTVVTPPGLTGNWVTPIAMNPFNSSNIYIGGSVMHNSYDKGSTWQVISPIIDNNDYITSLETAPQDSNVIVAASLGVLHKTSDHGDNWTSIVAGLPVDSAGISDVAISDNPLMMWVTFSGFKDGLKIFETNDGGVSWTNISGSLPNIPINCIEYQKGTAGDLYAGSDFGVFYKNDTMSDWVSVNTGLPYVIIGDLDMNYGNGKLRAATYGRGMYEADPIKPIQLIANDAGMLSINQPVTDSYCDSLTTPLVVTIRNYGSDTLTSVVINYQVDNGAIDSILWTGSLPKLATETDTLAQITFYAGAHDIRVFTSSPNNGADEFIGNNEKYTTLIVDTFIAAFPVAEGFESSLWPPQNWNLSSGASLWFADSTTGAYGLSSNSYYADFYNVASGTQSIVSPRIDLTTASSPAYLGFSHAYARYDTIYVDTLIVSVSADCGLTWTPIYMKWDTALATVLQFVLNPFIPAPNEWTTDILDISSYIGQNIKVRFEAHSGYSNRCYIDDINIFHTAVDLEEFQLNNLSILPNPSSGLFYLVDKSGIVRSYSLFNAEGKLIQQIDKGHNEMIDLRNQSNGLYFLRLATDKNVVVKKLSILK